MGGSRVRSLTVALLVGAGALVAQASGHGTSRAPVFDADNHPIVFDFVAVGTTSAPQPTTITNAGGGRLTIKQIDVTGRNAKDFHVAGDTCTHHSLPAGGTCKVNVVFAPTAHGTRVANLKITDNSPCLDYIVLAGSGTDTTTPVRAKAATCQLADGSIVGQPRPPLQCRGHDRFRIRIRPPHGIRIRNVVVQLGSRHFRVFRGDDITSIVDLRYLPSGRFTLRVRLTAYDGRVIVQLRHYLICAANLRD